MLFGQYLFGARASELDRVDSHTYYSAIFYKPAQMSAQLCDRKQRVTLRAVFMFSIMCVFCVCYFVYVKFVDVSRAITKSKRKFTPHPPNIFASFIIDLQGTTVPNSYRCANTTRVRSDPAVQRKQNVNRSQRNLRYAISMYSVGEFSAKHFVADSHYSTTEIRAEHRD